MSGIEMADAVELFYQGVDCGMFRRSDIRSPEAGITLVGSNARPRQNTGIPTDVPCCSFRSLLETEQALTSAH
jgi:hypothetical protein